METIKEEKKADLEQLLNSLIEKGWKPRGLNIMGKIVIDYDIEFAFDIYDSLQKGHWNFRELVSKESGLWQFVCENEMVNVPHPNKGKYPRDKLEREQYKYWDRTIGYYGEDNLDRIGYNWDKYQYRLIESSLKDESELEDFLLNSIKLD